jgi:glycine/D-amino acid oxidase-like deaminating enzyme
MRAHRRVAHVNAVAKAAALADDRSCNHEFRRRRSAVVAERGMKVIVVGGGAAGIAAAYTLLGGGARVSLYEARGRYGGRAFSDTKSIANFTFDMGPQYLQDPNVNPWMKIAGKLGFETVAEQYKAFFRVREAGNWVSTESTDVTRATHTAIEEAAQANKLFLNMPTLYRPAAAPSDEQLLAYATSPLGPIAEAAELWQYIAADRARQKDVKEVPNHFVKRGVGTLIKTYGEGLKKNFSSAYTEHLGMAVTAIRYRSTGVGVTSADEQQEAADACLVTVPPSVLARGTIAFNPALPATHGDAIAFLKGGPYKKVAIVLASVPDAIAVDTHYYVAQNNPEGAWQCYRLSLYPNVLVAHAAGDFARALDLRDDEDVVDMLKATLKACFPPIGFGGATAVTNWTKDPYARGAYSYSALKTRFDDIDLDEEFDTQASIDAASAEDQARIQSDKTPYGARLKLGVPLRQTLWFAGEATDVDAYGTIAGAYNEGVRAATEILAGSKGKKK